nr:hypothetical protein [Candidatus Sigynarchaeota archaeon]
MGKNAMFNPTSMSPIHCLCESDGCGAFLAFNAETSITIKPATIINEKRM